jgi:hypothetical protein
MNPIYTLGIFLPIKSSISDVVVDFTEAVRTFYSGSAAVYYWFEEPHPIFVIINLNIIFSEERSTVIIYC